MKKLMLLSTVFMLIFSAGCNSAGGGGDPKAVLKNFFDALRKKDITTAKKYATKDSESMLNMMEMGMNMAPAGEQDKMMDKFDLEMGDTKINGDMATVPVKEKKSGEGADFTLKKEGGDWKVAFDMGTMMEMGQQKMKEKGMNMDQVLDSIKEMQDKMGKSKMTIPDTVINGTSQ